MHALSQHPALVLFLSALAAGAIVALTEWLRNRRASSRQGRTGDAVFLFDGDTLIDSTPAARALLRVAPRQDSDLASVRTLLINRFPALADATHPAGLPDTSPCIRTVDGRQTGETLVAETWDRFTRLTIPAANGVGATDLLRLAALEDEVTTLRAIAEDSPQLIWKEDANGTLIWANRTYLALSDRLSPPAPDAPPAWPARPLFDSLRPLAEGRPEARRQILTLPNATPPQWFEVTNVRRGGQVVGFAVDATDTVAAEEARRSFVQTLTKTFAHLRAGLAIFDRQRRLVLFNPAFLDLTGLKVDFLSQRPKVHSVLDRLRDMQMLPEPKNYTSWRDQVAALEAAAEQGTYCETWMLPAGQTYRVSGRPHPDGAIAFIFEDISDEISLTRRFRLEQETVQAAIDLLPQGIAVFSAGGTMTLSNAAYGGLWGTASGGLDDPGLAGEMRRWQHRCVPSAGLDRLSPDLQQDPVGPRVVILHLTDGRPLTARFVPLPGGGLLAEFRDTPAEGLSVVATSGPQEPGTATIRSTGT